MGVEQKREIITKYLDKARREARHERVTILKTALEAAGGSDGLLKTLEDKNEKENAIKLETVVNEAGGVDGLLEQVVKKLEKEKADLLEGALEAAGKLDDGKKSELNDNQRKMDNLEVSLIGLDFGKSGLNAVMMPPAICEAVMKKARPRQSSPQQ